MRRYTTSLYAALLFMMFTAAVRNEAFALSGKIEDEERAEQEYGQGLRLAPEFTLRNLDKEIFTLSKYRGKQPVILFFWTTWCVNCREGIKTLNEMYSRIVKDKFEVLSINVGESESRVARFAKAYNLLFKVLLDPDTGTARSFGLIGVPTYIIIDKNGRIRFYDHYFPKDDFKRIVED